MDYRRTQDSFFSGEIFLCVVITPVYALVTEKAMATHSSALAWKIPGTGEPGGLLSTGSHRVRHDWSDLAAAAPVVLTGGKDKASVGIWQGWCDDCDQLKLLRLNIPLTSNGPIEGHNLFRNTWRLKRGWFWSLFCQQRKKEWRLSRQSTRLPSHLPARLRVGNWTSYSIPLGHDFLICKI